jgi:hypothetical protein
MAKALLEREQVLAAEVADLAVSAEEFDKCARALESGDLTDLGDERSSLPFSRLSTLVDDKQSPLEGLELGVAGLVYALASVRCWPAASCRGHPHPNAWSDVPVVFLAVSRHRAGVLEPLVRSTGCSFGIDAARPDLLTIYAPSIEETMALARQIMSERSAFPQSRPSRRRSGQQLPLAFELPDSPNNNPAD